MRYRVQVARGIAIGEKGERKKKSKREERKVRDAFCVVLVVLEG